MIEDHITCKGTVTMTVQNLEGNVVRKEVFPNAVLRTGREAIAAALANKYGPSFENYVSNMIFGDGGQDGEQLKYVNASRTGLFGVTRASKNVVSVIDSVNKFQVTYNAILSYEDANGYTLNEMALQLENGDLFSMATFGGIDKTSSMQITWQWAISFL
jgi:hypothetical protein